VNSIVCSFRNLRQADSFLVLFVLALDRGLTLPPLRAWRAWTVTGAASVYFAIRIFPQTLFLPCFGSLSFFSPRLGGAFLLGEAAPRLLGAAFDFPLSLVPPF